MRRNVPTAVLPILALSLFAVPAWANEPAAHDPTPAAMGTSPSSLCDDLCRKLYGSEPDNQALCKQGCDQAERCTNRCSTQFPDDADQLARCNYLCARAR